MNAWWDEVQETIREDKVEILIRNSSSIWKSRAMEHKLEGDVGGLAAFFMLIDMI